MGIQITQGARVEPELPYDRIQVVSFIRRQSTEPPYRTSVEVEYVPFAYHPDGSRTRIYDEENRDRITVPDYVAAFLEQLGQMTPEEQAAAIQLSLAADAGYGQIIEIMGTKDIKTASVQ